MGTSIPPWPSAWSHGGGAGVAWPQLYPLRLTALASHPWTIWAQPRASVTPQILTRPKAVPPALINLSCSKATFSTAEQALLLLPFDYKGIATVATPKTQILDVSFQGTPSKPRTSTTLLEAGSPISLQAGSPSCFLHPWIPLFCPLSF